MKNSSARTRASSRPASKKKTGTAKTAATKTSVKKGTGQVSRAAPEAGPAAKASRAGSTLRARPPKKADGKTTAKKATRTAKSSASKNSTSKSSAPEKKVTTVSPGKALRATKKRAPKDLAAQYGEKEKTVRKKATTKTPRKRRDAAARARLQEVIAPDDALLARLARAGAISSSLAPDNAGDKTFNTVKKRRSRYWETRCGKCGKSGRYRASAALCVGCGAILVRE